MTVLSSALLPHLRQTLPALSQYACKQKLSVRICTTAKFNFITSQTHWSIIRCLMP